MIQKPFDAISKADIEALIDNAVSECRTLEYKQNLPGESEGDKKKFLADVSSFGNASGGDILYGVKAAVDAEGKKTGAPESVQPIAQTTPDEAKRRLDDMIRNGISPRLRVQIKEVTGWGEQGFIIVLRIPKSFTSPHMVTFKGSSRFFSRNSAGKYPLDVDEIRTAFLATDSQAERIKRFREDRLSKVVADETPVVPVSPLRLVLHLIPIASFLNNERLDLSNERVLIDSFLPMGTSQNFGCRHNLDGLLIWIPSGERAHGYCQVFRHGALEAVDTVVFGRIRQDNQRLIVPEYERHVVDAVRKCLTSYTQIGITPPVVIALSLLGCKGACMYTDRVSEGCVVSTIDRDAVILPEVVIDSLDVDVPQVLKPIFDTVWNACDFRRSLNYDENGKWKPRQ